jgi:hypothetical protein
MFPENASDAKKIVNFKLVVYNYRRDSMQAFKCGRKNAQQ